jgi:hypothetical protein
MYAQSTAKMIDEASKYRFIGFGPKAEAIATNSIRPMLE